MDLIFIWIVGYLFIAAVSQYTRVSNIKIWKYSCKTLHLQKYCHTTQNNIYNKKTIDIIKHEIRLSMSRSFGAHYSQMDPQTFQTKSNFGDYQCNLAMSLTKQLKLKPQEIAKQLCQKITCGSQNIIERVDITGPGFINLHLSPHYIKSKLLFMLRDSSNRMGITGVECPLKIVVDYSSPNIAKEMHVGHLRSTIIGDTLANLMEFIGHKEVVRLNHVGDWGTQFGMLIQYMKELQQHTTQTLHSETQQTTNTTNGQVFSSDNKHSNHSNTQIHISDLAAYYKQAKIRFDNDPIFHEKSKQMVVKLQSKDRETIAAWEYICEISRREFNEVYKMLEISEKLMERGESFYNPYLQDVVTALLESKVAIENNGAVCIFLPVVGDNARKGKESKQDQKKNTEAHEVIPTSTTNTDNTQTNNTNTTPIIIQKTDSGFLYATTDLAALRHRIYTENADHLIYVTDSGQTEHFRNLFEVTKIAKRLFPNVCVMSNTNIVQQKQQNMASVSIVDSTDRLQSGVNENRVVKLSHVPFGVVTGDDGKKIKSRSGDSIKLKELLNEAVVIAKGELVNKMHVRGEVLDDADLNTRAHTIGIAAVKYADLSYHRESSYRFSFSQMLGMTGNTAPYMLYSYARIMGINRKVLEATNIPSISTLLNNVTADNLLLGAHEEMLLAKHIIRLDEVIHRAADDLLPHLICDYLFELSQKFNQFYEKCPVIKAETAEIQKSRVVLCELTAGTLKLCLKLLGIKTVEKL